jgi:Ribbon-helix-helix protein, copG family
MAAKTSRKPGRKPLHPDGSAPVVLRIEPDLLGKIGRLAKNHGKNRSKEIRDAIRFWVSLHRQDTKHVGELVTLIEMLVHDIEKRTGKRWVDDPLTGTAVRELVERLIYHLAPTPSERLNVPPEISEVLSFLIMQYENQKYVAWAEGVRPDDRSQALAILMRDLGSGFQRNRKIWLKGTGSEP